MPAGATLDLRCSGDSCPFKHTTKLVTKAKKAVSLLKQFKRRRLHRGVKLTLTVTVPRQIGIVKTQQVRKGKLNSSTTRCLAPGETKPTRC